MYADGCAKTRSARHSGSISLQGQAHVVDHVEILDTGEIVKEPEQQVIFTKQGGSVIDPAYEVRVAQPVDITAASLAALESRCGTPAAANALVTQTIPPLFSVGRTSTADRRSQQILVRPPPKDEPAARSHARAHRPTTSSLRGIAHPPCSKPPRRSSSDGPGPCMTPSRVTWLITTTLFICVSHDATRYLLWCNDRASYVGVRHSSRIVA